jgi:hypothetical protein
MECRGVLEYWMRSNPSIRHSRRAPKIKFLFQQVGHETASTQNNNPDMLAHSIDNNTLLLAGTKIDSPTNRSHKYLFYLYFQAPNPWWCSNPEVCDEPHRWCSEAVQQGICRVDLFQHWMQLLSTTPTYHLLGSKKEDRGHNCVGLKLKFHLVSIPLWKSTLDNLPRAPRWNHKWEKKPVTMDGRRWQNHLCPMNERLSAFFDPPSPPYIINHNPAVTCVPYEANIDIRDTELPRSHEAVRIWPFFFLSDLGRFDESSPIKGTI